MNKSKINPLITEKYIKEEAENKYFDCKSVRAKPSDLAPLICGFANAEGGTIVIGVDDKTRDFEGISSLSSSKLNEFLNIHKDCCRPMPDCREEYFDIVKKDGDEDRLLLLHISRSSDKVISTSNESVYLRIGDKTREIKGESLRNLEYNKGSIHFEDEYNERIKIEDLDENLIEQYKKILGAENIDTEQLLKARGFMGEHKGHLCLNNAAVLLFAENIFPFYPNCRVRFIRYDGIKAEVGTRMNIIKDVSIEKPILRLIKEAVYFVGTQLREFTSLNPATGLFETVPEYPEFAWTEGIVNAITHREYSMTGKYIKVTMFDDRLEIESPGRLPDPVTIENMRNTSFSRNPKIARVLTDFGLVRELNEGVKRIYSDMSDFFLDDPEFSEPGGHTVLLKLKNNIVMREKRKEEKVIGDVGIKQWNLLDEIEKKILVFMGSRTNATANELTDYTGRSINTIRKRINRLLELGIIAGNDSTNSPKRSYRIIIEK